MPRLAGQSPVPHDAMVVVAPRRGQEPALVALGSLAAAALVNGQADMVELCALNPQAGSSRYIGDGEYEVYELWSDVGCPWAADGDPASLGGANNYL